MVNRNIGMPHPALKPYRVLYNQDSSNLFAVTREPLTPAHVDRHVCDSRERAAGWPEHPGAAQ
jgi:hypothetical protein